MKKMATRNINNIVYRPPDTDSDEDYDGFYFGDELASRPKQYFTIKDEEEELRNAVYGDDLMSVKENISKLNFDVNSPLKGGYTLLMHACREGFYEIVEYLVLEKKANVNKQVDSITPLMQACDCKSKSSFVVDKICNLLLQHGAVINVSDKCGTTPFMLACKNGHTNIVRIMIKDVSFDTTDNRGCTPIFYAVENNHGEIVKILIDAGVNYSKPNGKGYTPKQVAQFHGFYDLLEFFPIEKEDGYIVPTQFLTYSTYHDYIPRVFLRSECPEYFQEVYKILLSINMERYLEYFAKERVPLSTFLCLDDKGLEKLGIQFPLSRMKILKGLLDFHLHNWRKKSLSRLNKFSKDNFYEVLLITAYHLKRLIIINSSLRFVRRHLEENLLGPVEKEHIQIMLRRLEDYQLTIKALRNTITYLASFSPDKNPLYIDYNEYLAERKRSRIKWYFKYTTIAIGISVFICSKFKRFF
uniref:SAM domain-containing protein n=1 Tax=Glossina palpalis gambiensis TaxID=67801 RepID=A0A1B0BSZ7_9MUSC